MTEKTVRFVLPANAEIGAFLHFNLVRDWVGVCVCITQRLWAQNDLVFKPLQVGDQVLNDDGSVTTATAATLSSKPIAQRDRASSAMPAAPSASTVSQPVPKTCVGVDPALLPHVDDDGTMVRVT
jgi:hypothetical protein